MGNIFPWIFLIVHFLVALITFFFRFCVQKSCWLVLPHDWGTFSGRVGRRLLFSSPIILHPYSSYWWIRIPITLGMSSCPLFGLLLQRPRSQRLSSFWPIFPNLEHLASLCEISEHLLYSLPGFLQKDHMRSPFGCVFESLSVFFFLMITFRSASIFVRWPIFYPMFATRASRQTSSWCDFLSPLASFDYFMICGCSFSPLADLNTFLLYSNSTMSWNIRTSLRHNRYLTVPTAVLSFKRLETTQNFPPY